MDLLRSDPDLLVLSFGLVCLIAAGLGFVLYARYWSRQRRQGRFPKPITVWSMANIVPRAPEFGYVFGALLLAGALVLFIVILMRVLNH